MPKVFKLVMQQNFGIKEKAKQLTKSWADMERSAREPSLSGDAESVLIVEAQAVQIDESEDNVTQDPGVSDEVVQGLRPALEEGRGQNERSSAANQEYAGRVAEVRNPLVAIAQERLGYRATANSKGTDGRMENAENAVPMQQKAQKKETTWNSKKNRQGRKKGSSGGVKRSEQEEPEEEENIANPKDGKKKKRKLYKPTMSDEAINEHSNTFSPIPKFRPFSN
ncbi:hypothetical protein BC936DRAFT_146212 [Jimgerdemannia flammicorona]|uniref:Uncharacterized protein n=1 Tax=Jimgerdemannia flammicorona TaxID=994334 RepID=A0A433D8V0_9FUNG|nr:hypothetical protein BC936DRAFT_146212 [Jimgerdemannia flammicorona]